MTVKIELQSVQIATGSDDQEGYLAFHDGRLVAVLVQLAPADHKELAGAWFIEAGFGPCASNKPPHFASLAEATEWLAKRVIGHARCDA